jgi:hypothetical protein
MVGGVISTSLGIAPALLIAQQANILDLDGPLRLALDRGATAARSIRLIRSSGRTQLILDQRPVNWSACPSHVSLAPISVTSARSSAAIRQFEGA